MLHSKSEANVLHTENREITRGGGEAKRGVLTAIKNGCIFISTLSQLHPAKSDKINKLLPALKPSNFISQYHGGM
jgi:hypothetical protein